MHTYRGNYILGQFVLAKNSHGELITRNPGDLRTPPLHFAFSYEGVNLGVEAAQKASFAWGRLAMGDRQGVIAKYKDELKKNEESLARIITEEVGTPLWETRLEVAETVKLIEFFLSQMEDPMGKEWNKKNADISLSVRMHPRGIAAIVAPGIQPLLDTHTHLIPALLYGNTVVLKSSRFAPLVGQRIAEIAHAAGLPAGILNVIHGDSEMARRLVCHAEVDLVFFTGSYETGLNLRKQVASDYWKVAVLEMVGKNALVIWKDCPIDKAVEQAMACAFQTTGQRRSTASRILVHQEIFDEFVKKFHAQSKKISIGYGLSEPNSGHFLGPLISQDAMENYIRYQSIAVRDGCEEIMRGKHLEREEKGYYVSPSIHIVGKADPKSMYQRSEIFGPNAALYRITDLEEAMEIVNHPPTGLVASVFSQDRSIFQRFCMDAKVGLLHWNVSTLAPTYSLPTSGMKKSGNNRPMGKWSWLQCTYPIASFESSTLIDSVPTLLPKAEN